MDFLVDARLAILQTRGLPGAQPTGSQAVAGPLLLIGLPLAQFAIAIVLMRGVVLVRIDLVA